MRTHGFKRPFHKLQIITWLYLTYLFSSFSFMTLTLFSYSIQVLLAVIYSIVLLFVLTLGFFCTYSDPTDPAISEASKAKFLS